MLISRLEATRRARSPSLLIIFSKSNNAVDFEDHLEVREIVWRVYINVQELMCASSGFTIIQSLCKVFNKSRTSYSNHCSTRNSIMTVH